MADGEPGRAGGERTAVKAGLWRPMSERTDVDLIWHAITSATGQYDSPLASHLARRIVAVLTDARRLVPDGCETETAYRDREDGIIVQPRPSAPPLRSRHFERVQRRVGPWLPIEDAQIHRSSVNGQDGYDQ